ncbi:hypothetical protein EVAR_86501_1 [Eumeta japonica]|uniref:Uncharacterized protein n=1 Tax=Eumeta variegata TaxID=151549 RepID=A0A4C1VRB3_EUMVA|nr:hypothetical protein EVAR_86501_1 [Eumeta japonica]
MIPGTRLLRPRFDVGNAAVECHLELSENEPGYLVTSPDCNSIIQLWSVTCPGTASAVRQLNIAIAANGQQLSDLKRPARALATSSVQFQRKREREEKYTKVENRREKERNEWGRSSAESFVTFKLEGADFNPNHGRSDQ